MAQLRIIVLLLVCLVLSSCSFNPFRADNELTGSATSTAVGAGIGAGGAYFAGASKAEIGLAGIAGGIVGYYVSTLRFASGGVIQSGGQVFSVGDFVTIEIPTDSLFDVNTSDLLPQAEPILDSAVMVLKRYPCNNILISGNTSGFGSAKYQRQLSEDRAKQVAAYLWAHGINNFEDMSRTRKLNYVGYGNYFPIANHYKAHSIRQNSRIQITSYPSKADLGLDRKAKLFNNVGAIEPADNKDMSNLNSTFKGDNLPESGDTPSQMLNEGDDSGETQLNLKGERWVN